MGHDSRVGACAVLSPCATINGHVTFEEQVFLGAQAVETPRLEVDLGANIWAGAVARTSTPAGLLALGHPARWLPASV